MATAAASAEAATYLGSILESMILGSFLISTDLASRCIRGSMTIRGSPLSIVVGATRRRSILRSALGSPLGSMTARGSKLLGSCSPERGSPLCCMFGRSAFGSPLASGGARGSKRSAAVL